MDKFVLALIIITTTLIELFTLYNGDKISSEVIRLILAGIIIIDILALIGLVLELS